MIRSAMLLGTILSLSLSQAYATAIFVNLGTADSFAVLAGSTVTNTGPSRINGDVGVSPGTAVVGFPPGIVAGGTIHDSDAIAGQAQRDFTAAYNFAASEVSDTNLTGTDLGGLTLRRGVYTFASSAQLTGTLVLDAQGDPNAVFVFQIGSTLATASNASVSFLNGSSGLRVFFQVGSSATLGTNTAFQGNILALASITLNTGSSIGCGRALAGNGAVTLDTNVVSIATATCETVANPGGGTGGTAVPEPASLATLLVGLFGFAVFGVRRPNEWNLRITAVCGRFRIRATGIRFKCTEFVGSVETPQACGTSATRFHPLNKPRNPSPRAVRGAYR